MDSHTDDKEPTQAGEAEPDIASPEPLPCPNPEDPGPVKDAVTRSRERRHALHRRKPLLRLSEAQQWLFIVLAIALALAWLLGRDACTRTITNTYGTLDPRKLSDGGVRRTPTSSPGVQDAAPDPTW